MSLLFWKNNRQIDAFAQAVADDLFSFVQPDIATRYVMGTGDIPKKKQAKVRQKFSDILLQVKRFSESKSLGVYGKARLQKRFNERLEELGYPTEVVNKIAESFLLQNV